MSKKKFRSAISLFVCMAGVCAPLLAANDQVHVVPGPDLKLWWQPDPASPNKPAPYPVEALKADVEGCLAVAFEIHSDGTVSNERVWLDKLPRFSYRKQMEQSALIGVHRWRFIPATGNVNREPVYTYQTVTYTLTGSTPNWTQYDQEREAKFKAECEIPDFQQQVQAIVSAKASTSGNP